MRLTLLVAAAISFASCAVHTKPVLLDRAGDVDARMAAHVVNRTSFGVRPGDIERVRAMGLLAYLDEQLHPERLREADDRALSPSMESLKMSARTFGTGFYQPMIAARLAFANSQKPGGIKPPAPI